MRSSWRVNKIRISSMETAKKKFLVSTISTYLSVPIKHIVNAVANFAVDFKQYAITALSC